MTTGSSNTFVGAFSTGGTGALTNATAIGANARVDQSNSLVLGGVLGVGSTPADVDVGIVTTAPAARLHIGAIGGGDDVLIQSSGAPNVVGEQLAARAPRRRRPL